MRSDLLRAAAAAILLAAGGTSCAPRPPRAAPAAVSPSPAPAHAPAPRLLSEEERELELVSFDFVWNTIRQKHWDALLGGLDWQAVSDSLRPKVEQARTRRESLAAMEAMIATLGQSHFGIIPTDVYSQMGEAGGEGVPGFDLRILDARAVVVFVDAESPAFARGIRPGWELLRARSTDIPAKLAILAPSFAGKSTRELLVTRAIMGEVQGAIGDTLPARFRDGADHEVELRVPLARPEGNRTVLGNLPPVYAFSKVRRLGSGAGYIKVSMFLDPAAVMGAVGEAVPSFRNAPGIVIDLRGNPGGIGAMAMGMAGWFVAEEGRKLGTMIMRGNQFNFAVAPRPDPYPGKVAILVDGLSASTAEIFAAGLRDLKRARIFGVRTAGAALPSIVEKLPNGDGFQYAVANYISEGGVTLEGNGVVPDSTVVLSRETLLAGRDAQLDAATGWIGETR